MNVFFDKKVVIEGLTKCLGAIDKKNINPVLQYCLVEKKQDRLFFKATDLDVLIEVEKDFNAGPAEDFAIMLPAKIVLDFVKALSLEQGQICCSVLDKNRIALKTKNTSLTVSTVDTINFPSFEKSFTVISQIEIEKKALKELFDNTQYAMALSDVRYYLNGLFLQIQGEDLVAVGTDGHRLALARRRLLKNITAEGALLQQWILPRRAVLEIQKLLDNSDETITLIFGKDTLFVKTSGLNAGFKLIEGKYPDYRRVIPKKSPFCLRVSKEPLKEALNVVHPVLTTKDKGMTFFLSADRIKIKAMNAENQEVSAEINLLSSNAQEDLKISFNMSYIYDFVAHAKGQEISFLYQDANSGVVLSSEADTQYVVMPLIL